MLILAYLMTKTKKERTTGGGKICVYCTNSQYSNTGQSFHRFPHPNRKTRAFKAWCNAVQKVRKDWTHPYYRGCKESTWASCVVCSDHFKREIDFVPQTNRLKPQAVPIFHPQRKEQQQTPRKTKVSEGRQSQVNIYYYIQNIFVLHLL